MTSRNDDMHEAEFEDFLQGKGELASLLQDLPQAQPTAELDTAIIAQAERALAAPLATATSPAIVPAAANDVIGPEGSGNPPSFLWRWKLPLSLAASVLFAIPVVMQQNQETFPTDPVTAAAPDAHVPQEKINSALPQLAQADLAKQAKVATELAPPAAASMDNAMPPAMETSKTKESRKADDSKRASVANPRSEYKLAERQAEPTPPPPTILAAAPEPTKVPITGSAIRRQEVSSAAPVQTNSNVAGAEEKEAAENHYASNAKMRALTANASHAKAEAAGMLAKSSETASTDKKSDLPAAAPFPAAQPAPRIVMAAPPVAAAPPLSAAQAPESHPGAYDWLQKIEQLLKNHRNKEALDEWRKFRAVYPAFTVDQSLQKQIDALQKYKDQ
ncbi:MAG: hypothetical protein WA071_11410 [Undibacterium umbellatum]|uniref:hypothetical protein n=1 Tax=Undibacterium umbellatum TaxID=2762300 RepID=UPI003BB4B76C